MIANTHQCEEVQLSRQDLTRNSLAIASWASWACTCAAGQYDQPAHPMRVPLRAVQMHCGSYRAPAPRRRVNAGRVIPMGLKNATSCLHHPGPPLPCCAFAPPIILTQPDVLHLQNMRSSRLDVRSLCQ